MKNQNEFILHTKSKKHLQLVQKLKQAQLARKASVGQKNPEPPSLAADVPTSSTGNTKSSSAQLPAGFLDRPVPDDEAPQQVPHPEVQSQSAPDDTPVPEQPTQLSQRELFRMLEEEEERQFVAQASSKATDSPEKKAKNALPANFFDTPTKEAEDALEKEFNQFRAEIEQEELIHQEKAVGSTQQEDDNIQEEIQREVQKEKTKQAHEFDHLQKIALGEVNIAPISLPKKTKAGDEPEISDEDDNIFEFSWRSKQF